MLFIRVNHQAKSMHSFFETSFSNAPNLNLFSLALGKLHRKGQKAAAFINIPNFPRVEGDLGAQAAEVKRDPGREGHSSVTWFEGWHPPAPHPEVTHQL